MDAERQRKFLLWPKGYATCPAVYAVRAGSGPGPVLVLVLVRLCCAVMLRAMRVCKISKVSYLLPRHLSQTMDRSLMMTAQDKVASIIERPPHMSFIKAFMTASHSHPRTMLKRNGICDSIQIADFYFHSRFVFFLHFYTRHQEGRRV